MTEERKYEAYSRVNTIVGGRFRLVQILGYGTFGDIYNGHNVNTKEEVAIKVENRLSPSLLHESRVYKILEGTVGIPRIRWYGDEEETHILVMDLLGPSLKDLFKLCDYQFSLKTVLTLAIEMISRLESIHSRNFVHRDLKPGNLMMGVGRNCDTLYVIDFGMAKRYRNDSTKRHAPFCQNENMAGTPRYASITAHDGYEQSRRDDLESLGYVLMHFLRGDLPWDKMGGFSKYKQCENISKCKKATSVDDLCKGYPREFAIYLNYCRRLEFEEDPDYKYLRELFSQLFRTRNFTRDNIFDWTMRAGKVAGSVAERSLQQSASVSKTAAEGIFVKPGSISRQAPGAVLVKPGSTSKPAGAVLVKPGSTSKPAGAVLVKPGSTSKPAGAVLVKPGSTSKPAGAVLVRPSLPPSGTSILKSSLQTATDSINGARGVSAHLHLQHPNPPILLPRRSKLATRLCPCF